MCLQLKQRVVPVQYSVTNHSNVCAVGANRRSCRRKPTAQGVMARRRPVGCPPAQVTGARRHERPKAGWSDKRQNHASIHRHNPELWVDGRRVVDRNPSMEVIPSSRFSTVGRAPPGVESGRRRQPNRTACNGASPLQFC